MTDYIDAILHIADVPDMIGALPPEMVSDGVVIGIARTPMTMQGVSGLVYVRMTPEDAAQWRGTPLVTILAEAPYSGDSTTDEVYSAMESNAKSMALYDAVYPRESVSWIDDDGVKQYYKPPFRFGAIG